MFVDWLGELLDGTRDLDEAHARLAAVERGEVGRHHLSLSAQVRERSASLIARYRDHILSHCPDD